MQSRHLIGPTIGQQPLSSIPRINQVQMNAYRIKRPELPVACSRTSRRREVSCSSFPPQRYPQHHRRPERPVHARVVAGKAPPTQQEVLLDSYVGTELEAGLAFQPCGSHTRMASPLAPLECYGCYRITGPASIKKVGRNLHAELHPGSHVDFFSNQGTITVTQDMIAALSHQQGPVCIVLTGHHMELQGDFDLPDKRGTLIHDDKVVLTVGALSNASAIQLTCDGQLSHPLNLQQRPKE